MPTAYTPSAPNGVGTDDYRCFLLDPRLARDSFLTGTDVLPGNPDVVHHVILFRVDADQVAEARAKDAAEPGEGWTCFGGTGLQGDFAGRRRQLAGRVGAGRSRVPAPRGTASAWTGAPGSSCRCTTTCSPGEAPDTSSARAASGAAQRRPDPAAHLPDAGPRRAALPAGPRPPLCDRAAAVADVKARFGQGPGSTGDLLHLLCGDARALPGDVLHPHVSRPMTVLGVAGHMHLLGRSIRIVTNPGTPRARTVLDIPLWDFDNQGSKPITPVHLDPFDTVRVTCRHVQWLRDRLPAFAGQPDRYVVWGEGTTDEMCLGMLQVAFDGERA